MTQRAFNLTAGTVFLTVAILHALRLFFRCVSPRYPVPIRGTNSHASLA